MIGILMRKPSRYISIPALRIICRFRSLCERDAIQQARQTWWLARVAPFGANGDPSRQCLATGAGLREPMGAIPAGGNLSPPYPVARA